MGRIYGTVYNNIAKINLKDEDCKCIESEDLLIFVDGEIENKEEIVKNLNLQSSYNNSDVNLLKKLYKKYNEEFIDKIEGFFAIIVYDKKENKLILVRDKIGVKQLYFYIKGDFICFASELKDIMSYPSFEKKINYSALSMYFRYTYINPPNTIFENTYKLEHGHYVVYKDGKIQNKTYWDGIEKYNILSNDSVKNFNEAKEQLENLIEGYLEKIIKNNENVGIYLSGGIDSSLVSAICSKISKKPINTFSIGFYEKERNEAEKAKKIAEYLGTNHHELYISERELVNTIKKIPEYYDEPFSDASEIPTVILNEFARKNNIKIAITGDGADQLFCGSTVYDKMHKIERAYKFLNPFNINLKTKKFLGKKLLRIYANNNKKNQTQTDIILKEYYFTGLFKDIGEKRYNFEDRIENKSWQVKRMILDVNTFLADRINTKTNRASNANGIYIKSPFLSNKVIEYSFKIPQKFKYYKKEKKYILKQILYNYIPKELLYKRKKGFGIPIKKWLTTYLYEDLIKVSNKEFIERQNIFDYKVLNRLLKKLKTENEKHDLHQILWDFYMFQLWYIKYVEN